MPESYQLQYDERGRPYFQRPGQPKRYVSPVSMGGTRPDDTTSIFHSRPQWNARAGQWETPFDWGNLMNVGVGAGLGAGVASAAGLFGGAAGTAGSGGFGVPGLGAAGSPGGAFYGAAAPAAARGFLGRSAGNWLTDALFAGLPAITGLIGAKTASDASDRAAQIQADAFDRGLTQQREMYETDRADFAPYRDAGGRAVTRMADLTANYTPPSMPASVSRRLTGAGDTYTPIPSGGRSMADLARPSGYGQTPAAAANRPTPQASQQPAPVSTTMPVDGRPALITASHTVRMQAPTGEQQDVPLERVAFFESRGARRVA